MNKPRTRLFSILPLFLSCSIILFGCAQPSPQPQTNTPPSQPSTKESQEVSSVQSISTVDLVNWSLDLEDNFKLQDVLVSQATDTIIVRFKAPTLTGETLNNGLAQIFSYLDGKLPSQILNINLVFMVQNVDSLIVSVSREDIKNWKENKISNADFIKKFKKTSLL